MKYKAVLFDVDDTLLKTSAAKWAQHKHVAKKYYDVKLTDDRLKAHWGKPFDDMIQLLYGGVDTLEGMSAHFAKHELEFPKQMYEDTLPTIQALHDRGVVLGMVTSMRWEIARIEIKLLGLPLDYFAVLQGCDNTKFHKPDPRVFDPARAILAGQGITDRIVYVGDALGDFYAARDAGFDFIGVTTGFVNEAAFHKAGVRSSIGRLSQLLQ
jgi:phosphoglycolate phosphatase-like HAD superfamily hydrolase